jgi:hypothetical protein
MALTQAALVLRCPRCAGPMYSSYHDANCAEYGCLLCGEYVFTPAAGKFAGEYKHQAAKAGSSPMGWVEPADYAARHGDQSPLGERV